MVKPTPLAARGSVKGCREQPLLIFFCYIFFYLILFAGCGCSVGFSMVADDYHRRLHANYHSAIGKLKGKKFVGKID
jgi:hypothetical protein